ncbi:hypothetical protein [Noviherbaspirillum sedimenti]|uniref:DUF4145 domain-containing protein n=1 Tax=Noviherbaspirillum sedimenti TaxID=2320865 RepID=A0A3A3G2V7_9BURK|nr:hypothetical protein [Noviherbaspirillum sedimenti]RJG02271.1 hypothetical protein D3878_12370 [Noviherbaspirillum sedimenti]
MADGTQGKLLSPLNDIEVVRVLLADLHDDLGGKVARFHQLSDLSGVLGSTGTMLPGGETAYAAWIEARASFVHGNYVATVMLCQGLAEHVLAAELVLGIQAEELPKKISFQETLRRCLARGVLSQNDVDDLRRLMDLRNPLSHFRNIDDLSNLSRRALGSALSAQTHLLLDATFAVSMAVRLLALPAFRLGD